MTFVTARELNQDLAAAKRAAAVAPVIVTDRGTPAYVLMSIDDYRRLVGQHRNLADLLRMSEDIDFEPEHVSLNLRIPEL